MTTSDLTEAEQLFERSRLEVKLIDYWHDVDVNWGDNAASFYTENAIFGGAAGSHEGRTEIAQYYAVRKARGDRVSVHCVQNFRVEFNGRSRAEAQWYLVAYAANGKPVFPAQAPVVIARVRDHYQREESGDWLCDNRNFEVLFTGK